MHKKLLLVSTLALSASLFVGQSYNAARAQTAEALNPKGGWSINRIGASSDQGYCALSRKYSGDKVLTLGRNTMEEYSLAIDFLAENLNVDKAYSITLQPGPGQIRAYEMMPASLSAMVVRLGYDDSFFNALEKSGKLKAEIDGKKYEFNVPEFSKGKADLTKCMGGLKAAPATKVAKGFSAQKIDDAPPMKAKRAAPAKAVEIRPTEAVPPRAVAKAPVAAKAAPVIEMKKAASKVVTKPVEIKKAEIVPPKVENPKKSSTPRLIEMSKVSSKKIDVPQAKRPIAISDKEIPVPAPIIVSAKDTMPKIAAPKAATPIATPMARAPAPKIERPQVVSKTTPKPTTSVRSNNDALLNKRLVSKQPDYQPRVVQTNLQKQQREALEQLKADNERLNKALQTELRRPEAQSPDRTQEVALLKAENDRMKAAIQQQTQQQVAAKKKEVEKPAVQTISKKTDPTVQAELNNLKAENARLANALQGKEERLLSNDKRSPAADAELAKVRAQMKELEIENRVLQLEARKARGQIDTAVVDTSNQALQKMRAYEKKLAAAASDNATLAKEVEELRRMQEDKSLGIVAGDWDLEKATRRYNEAEREIKRMGMLLEQQRSAHRQERAELEGMLFDPAVTDKEQRRKLAELELQLEAAEKQLQTSGRTLAATPRFTPRAPMEERVAINRTMPASPAPMVERQRENLEMKRLNNQVMRQNNQLKAYERERQQMADASMSTKLSQMSPMTVTSRPAPAIAPKPAPQQQAIAQRPAVSTAPRARVAPVKAQPVRASAAAQSTLSFGESDIRQVLGRSGISGNVMKQSDGKYRWNKGKLTGQAQVVSAAKAGSVDRFAQSYIARAKQSCGGDFASLPTVSSGQNKSFEIACISSTRSTSSSVVFTQKGNDIIAIAHEASADDMDIAMDARDRVASNL